MTNSALEVAPLKLALLMSQKKEKTSSLMIPGKAPTLARATTLAQVAEFVGVSQSAVSVVLNDSRSKVRVSEQTRQRIIDAARELNYQPNILVRSLQKRRTNIFGFYSDQGQIFDPSFPFFGQLLKGLMEGCEEHEKNFLIHGSFLKRSEEDICLELMNGQIDGLILYARDHSPLVERLVESHLPVVTVADAVPGLPCVTIDEEQGGRLLARHLSEKGYQRSLFCVTDLVLPSTIQARQDAFEREAKKLGLSAKSQYLTPLHSRSYDVAQEIRTVLGQEADVLVAYNDFMADHLVTSFWKAGISVPKDIAVTGFDGFTSTCRPAPLLTTIRAPWDEVARKAVSLLVDQCNGISVPQHTYMPVELIIGQTT